MHRYDYHKPTSLAQAWQLAEEIPGARFVAGGTDLLVRIKHGHQRPPALISLRALPELQVLDEAEELRIGAAVPMGRLLRSEALQQRYPVLAEAMAVLGSPQIRNVATLGGNLCNASPAADTAPALLVLDARVELASAAGSRQLPLAQFFCGPGETSLAPGELMTCIVLPPSKPGCRARYLRKTRVGMDLAKLSLAALLELDGARCLKARLAVGAVAPVPLRLKEVERALEGQLLSDALIEAQRSAVQRLVAPIDDLRSTADYRRQVLAALAVRLLRELRGAVGGGRVGEEGGESEEGA